jgi:queuosine precursor transporter
MTRFALLAAYIACVPVANWLIGNVGTTCVPNGPCLIPVGFGLMAPSGVLMIGLALVLRDAVHERLGIRWVLASVAAGAALSAFVAPPALVIASAAAFLLSELADLSVYTPLRRRKLWLAVLASGVVGALMDSVAFLYLAFGSLAFLSGQMMGKAWATLIVAGVLWLRSQRQTVEAR